MNITKTDATVRHILRPLAILAALSACEPGPIDENGETFGESGESGDGDGDGDAVTDCPTYADHLAGCVGEMYWDGAIYICEQKMTAAALNGKECVAAWVELLDCLTWLPCDDFVNDPFVACSEEAAISYEICGF